MNICDFREQIASYFVSLWYEKLWHKQSNIFDNENDKESYGTQGKVQDCFFNDDKYLWENIDVVYFCEKNFIKISTSRDIRKFNIDSSKANELNEYTDLVKVFYDDILNEISFTMTINYYEKENFFILMQWFFNESERCLKELSYNF